MNSASLSGMSKQEKLQRSCIIMQNSRCDICRSFLVSFFLSLTSSWPCACTARAEAKQRLERILGFCHDGARDFFIFRN